MPTCTMRSMLPRRLDHGATLGDGDRQRLLDIHILAGLAGGDGLDGVPVVGRGDDERVDVRTVEQHAEVLHSDRAAGDLGHAGNTRAQASETWINLVVFGMEVRCVHIAERHDLRIGLRQERLQELAAAVAHADEPEPHLVAGGSRARRCRGRHGTSGRGGSSRGRRRCPRELTAVVNRRHGDCLSPAASGRPYQGNGRRPGGPCLAAPRTHQKWEARRSQWSSTHCRLAAGV